MNLSTEEGDELVAEYNQTCHISRDGMLKFYDFFAGAGLTTLALQGAWKCVWANDIDPRKATVYRSNFPSEPFECRDIAEVSADELPVEADLAWASFPCQDLSLAGWRRGLSAERSGTFWQFWHLMHQQFKSGRRPPIIVIENVLGLLYGENFNGLCEALAALGMQFGALVIDAKHFLPQSRPRVFLVAVDVGRDVEHFTTRVPNPTWCPRSLLGAVAKQPPSVRQLWQWWHLKVPETQRISLATIIEHNPTSVVWNSAEETKYILSLMDKNNLKKINAVRQLNGMHVGFLYRRIRQGKQRAEVRFDGVAGCLRTPQGGSSRQTVVVVDNGNVQSRLLSPREAARLMGAPDSFELPRNYNEAYKAMGDGVAVPVVRWLSEQLLTPLARGTWRSSGTADSTLSQSSKTTEQKALQWSVLTNGKSQARRSRA